MARRYNEAQLDELGDNPGQVGPASADNLATRKAFLTPRMLAISAWMS